MYQIFTVSFRGMFRDRVYYGILSAGLLLFIIPQVSSLSMRIVTELSITLSLSLISFILLLLAIFLGGTSLWRDMERRYTFSVLGLPVTRGSYLLGKFAGTAVFLVLTALFFGLITVVMVMVSERIYPPARPVVWINLVWALGFDACKYVLLVACAYLISTVSTSFFLPVFGSISLFFAGSASQGVYDFVHSAAGTELAPLTKLTATGLYYLLPNFSAFDLNVNAIYGIPLSATGLVYTAAYFLIYTALVLTAAVMLFSAREMK